MKKPRIIFHVGGPKKLGAFPPGHFSSPLPSVDQIVRYRGRIAPRRSLPGVDLNEQEQLSLLTDLSKFYGEQPFRDYKSDGLRYYFRNGYYSYSDAIFLYCMLRHLRPRRIIEIGCDFSSCVMLDTSRHFFANSIEFTFIDPYPEVLASLTPSEAGRLNIIPMQVQDVDPEIFTRLAPNDLLFVDSSHVSKLHSDVNHIFFELLPRLPAGVFIHFHDIFCEWEYPGEWTDAGWYWNEIYILRAFLQFNSKFKIRLMNTFLEEYHREFFEAHMPLCLKNLGGSIWLQRTA